MPELTWMVWTVGIAALVLGILAGHYGWGKRWPGERSKLNPDYLTGLDYLVTEQPDRALDVFLKLMDASPDTVETHFSLGSLYRRRGEVERAIRIHQNLLARDLLAPEHREQALLALAQDYLRAGLLDRAEGLFQQVSEVPRLRGIALDALRGVYERQAEWQLALDVYRRLARMAPAPARAVAGHYLCELAAAAMERGDMAAARRLIQDAQREVSPFPRAAVLGSRLAERAGDGSLALQSLREAVRDAPKLLQEELPNLLRLSAPGERETLLGELVAAADAGGIGDLKQLVFAAILAGLTDSPALAASLDRLFVQDIALRAVWQPAAAARPVDRRRTAREIGALLANAEKYRCGECGFAGRNFYWHCPACHAWDTFEPYAIVKLG